MLRDPDFVRRWFAHRADLLGLAAESLVVDLVRPMSRGVSRQTWEVQVRDATRQRALIVRRDHEVGSVIPTSLRTEHDVYAALGQTEVPHARVLWWEDHPDWMPDSRRAYVREMVAGDWQLPVLAVDPATVAHQRIALAQEHLRKLAQVHAVDWRALGLDHIVPTPDSPESAAAALIDHCLGQLHQYWGGVGIAAAQASMSLRARAPRDVERLVFCKGTNGHGEEVWRDGRIVALSDWELAVIGDPAYDFAQCQELIADIVVDGHRVWGVPEALAYYREITGNTVTEDRVAYYRDLMALQQHVYTQHAAWVVDGQDYPPLRFVWTATEVAYRSELRLAAESVGELLTEPVA